MRQQIFRKSSIDRVNSPEQLNEYIRVANPSVWLVLGAVTALLVGVCIWGIFGSIDTTVKAPVVVKDGAATGYVAADKRDGIEPGTDVSIGDVSVAVVSVSDAPVRMGDDVDPYVFYLGGFSQGDFCYQAEISAEGLPDGIYEAKMIIDRVSPIYFVVR